MKQLLRTMVSFKKLLFSIIVGGASGYLSGHLKTPSYTPAFLSSARGHHK